MSSFYRLDEARFIQMRSAVSAANALNIYVGPVPTNRMWTVLAGVMYPSADENTPYWYTIQDRGGVQFPITIPVTFQTAIAQAKYFPLLTEGTEIAMFQGELLYACRQTAVAGSTLTIYARIIESDIPLHKYIEPQAARKFRSGWFGRSIATGGGGGGGEGLGGGYSPELPPRGGGEPVL